MEKISKLLAGFLRFQYYPHLLLALVYCLVSQYFVSFRNLAEYQSAKVLEMYVIFLGIILLTPLFMPEQDREIWRLEQTKKTPLWQLYGLRLLVAVLLIVGIVTGFLLVMQQSNSEVPFQKMWLGALGEVIFLGSIGFCVSGITNQVILGYMLAVTYFAVNIGKSKVFGQLALFQMMKGEYDFAGWMFLAAAVLFIAGIVIRESRK